MEQDIKSFAPVLIPTLNRYEHLRRCIESLANCTHAKETELIIGLDYPPSEKYEGGWKKICEFLPTVTGFKKVTIINREKNLGAVGNMNALIDFSNSLYDRYIFTEDDNEFSPCFLDFMNKGLEYYKDNPKVLSISGFNQYYVANKQILFTYDNSAWGWGRWRDKYSPCNADTQKAASSIKTVLKMFHYYPALLNSIVRALKNDRSNGDANMSCYCIAHDCYQLRPTVSLVRNWGHDGSGVHCGVSDSFVNIELPAQSTFSFQPLEPKRTKEIDSLVRNNMMPKSRKRNVRVKIRVLYDALSYCLRSK